MKQKLEKAIKQIRERYHVPAIMVGVCKDGESFFIGEGAADIEKNNIADENTLFDIGSATKAFTATSLCILADEGLLCLDDPVKKYIPEFAMYDSYMTEHLTIRDALTHRSGLTRHEVVRKNLTECTIDEIVHKLRYLPPAFEPRTRFSYQNTMYILGGLLVEKISGKVWYDFAKERIWDPLGMTRTCVLMPDQHDESGNEARPYAYLKGGFKRIPYGNVGRHVGPAGGISSTVSDMDKWVRLHLNRGVFEGKRIFSEQAAKEMHNPQMIIRPGEMYPWDFDESEFESYGLGWFIESYRGHKMVSHAGSISGFKSNAIFFPKENIALTILTNLDRTHAMSAIGYAFADILLGLPEIDWCDRFLEVTGNNKKIAEEASAAVLKTAQNAPPFARPIADYAGAYEEPGYGRLEVAAKGKDLFALIAGGEFKLLPAGGDRFVFDATVPEELDFGTEAICGVAFPGHFETDSDGKIHKIETLFEAMTKQYTVFTKIS